jgi:hypothetical protein
VSLELVDIKKRGSSSKIWQNTSFQIFKNSVFDFSDFEKSLKNGNKIGASPILLEIIAAFRKKISNDFKVLGTAEMEKNLWVGATFFSAPPRPPLKFSSWWALNFINFFLYEKHVFSIKIMT